MTLATPMAVAQQGLDETVTQTVTLREGHNAYVILTQPLGFGGAYYVDGTDTGLILNTPAQRNVCGQGQTDPCFIIHPSTGLEQGKKPPFISVVAAGDNCKNKPDTLPPRLQIRYDGGNLHTFVIKDDDDFAHLYCDGTMTDYHPQYMHDNGCKANEWPGRDNVCLTACAPGQIYRERLQATGGPGCETPPG